MVDRAAFCFGVKNIDEYDAVALIGFILLVLGIGIGVSIPAALCVSGGLLLALGVLGSRGGSA